MRMIARPLIARRKDHNKCLFIKRPPPIPMPPPPSHISSDNRRTTGRSTRWDAGWLHSMGLTLVAQTGAGWPFCVKRKLGAPARESRLSHNNKLINHKSPINMIASCKNNLIYGLAIICQRQPVRSPPPPPSSIAQVSIPLRLVRQSDALSNPEDRRKASPQ